MPNGRVNVIRDLQRSVGWTDTELLENLIEWLIDVGGGKLAAQFVSEIHMDEETRQDAEEKSKKATGG